MRLGALVQAANYQKEADVHNFRRSIPATLSLLSLSGLVLAFGGQAAASTAAPSRTSSATPSAVAAIQAAWSSVPDYPASPMIDHGTVRDSGGQAVPGATVILFPVLLGPAAGTVMTPLARATTDSSGHFAIHLPASRDALLANRKSAGALNLHVMAFYPGGSADWFTPIPAGAHAVAPVATLTLRTAGQAATATPAAPSAPEVCIDQKPKVLSGFPVTVGYKSSLDTNLAYTAFSYGTGVSNTFGTGVSITGPGGGFSANGTTSEADNTGVTFPNIPGASSNNYRAGGAYYDQEIVCGPIVTHQWELYQDAVGGDDGTPGAEPLSAGDCFTGGANTSVKIDATKQTDFSQGVDLEADGINLNLSSQDGYSSSSTLTYKFGSKSAPYCGVHNFPGATQAPAPGHIVVHAAS
jgi:hypothetical protein